MSWSIKLISNKEITTDEVSDIVRGLPDNLVIPLFLEHGVPKRNSWGWSAATDINIPVENTLTISGSYAMSFNKSKDMALFLTKELQERGHVIKEEFNE